MLEDDLVYALLLSNPTMNEDAIALFDLSGHGNLLSTALDETNLAAAAAVMAKQRLNGKHLNIRPKHLLVPQELAHAGHKLTESSEILQVGATDGVYGTANVLRRYGLQVVTESRLGVAGVVDPRTGTHYAGSATNWFLAAARRTIRKEYLSGTGRRPEVRSFVLNQGSWGMGFDIKFDFGAHIADWRGLLQGNA
jgi:hypothetical protein